MKTINGMSGLSSMNGLKPPVEHMDLLKAIANIITLSDEKKKILEREFKPFRCEKGKILLFEGDTEEYLRYIETGVCRVYVVDKEGIDHSIDFIFPGQWATGFASFIHQKQSNQYIETLTDISGRRISCSQLEKLYNLSDDFNYIGRRFVEEVTVALSERIHSFVTASPIERYERILDKNPELIKTIPSKYPASYIGITPEFLSRLRKRLIKKRLN